VTAASRGGPPGRGAPYISISASHRLAVAHAPSPVTDLVQMVGSVCSWFSLAAAHAPSLGFRVECLGFSLAAALGSSPVTEETFMSIISVG